MSNTVQVSMVNFDDKIEVYSNGNHVASLAFNSRGQLAAWFANRAVTLAADENRLPSANLNVETLDYTPSIKIQGSVTTTVISAPTSSPLTTEQHSRILAMIGESWANNPEQSRRFTREETHRIAQEVFGESSKKTVMSVAGVRAALTSDKYDISFDDLVEMFA